MFLSTAVCYCFDLLEPRVFQIALNVQDPTFIASPLSSPVFPPVTPQIGPSMNIPQMGASVPINYYQNYFVGFPQGPTLSELCPHCRATSSTARFPSCP
ncbi:hypothetical protein KY285_036958 [Solanum tuberosum]|nr:hypothetical protein KY285_036958 [Solanum tuberosum]